VDVQLVLDALSSPVRREILWQLWDQELAAGEIASRFEVGAPTISSHLAMLRDAGLVTMRADGNFRRYRARRDALRSVQALLASESTKWSPDRGAVEAGAAVDHDDGHVAEVATDVPVAPARVFGDFTEAEAWSRWLGVPVRIEGRHFSTTMEWGTRIRGTVVTHEDPPLIVFRWDFEDDAIPIPGDTVTALLEITPTETGSHVAVAQIVATREQAEFMHVAWGFVLGRYAASFG
jgi:DNA-binding transcriptional ArsR family regulator